MLETASETRSPTCSTSGPSAAAARLAASAISAPASRGAFCGSGRFSAGSGRFSRSSAIAPPIFARSLQLRHQQLRVQRRDEVLKGLGAGRYELHGAVGVHLARKALHE